MSATAPSRGASADYALELRGVSKRFGALGWNEQ